MKMRPGIEELNDRDAFPPAYICSLRLCKETSERVEEEYKNKTRKGSPRLL